MPIFRLGVPLLLGATILSAAVPARADIIAARTGGIVPTGDGYYAYTYSAVLTGGQLDPVSTGKSSFATVYDFGTLARDGNNNPYMAMTGLLASVFAFTFNNSDAPASQTAPFDDPSLTNIRFTYTGDTLISAPAGGDNVDLGTFQVYSPYDIITTGVQYDGQTYKTTNDTIQGNVGFTTGPQNPVTAAVPEPASLGLLMLGLLGLGFVRRSAT